MFILFWITLVISFISSSLSRELQLGTCTLVFDDQPCPDPRVSFFLFTRANQLKGEQVTVREKWDNISLSNYNSSKPSKILIHGYNGHKYFNLLMDIKTEYLHQGDYNIWSVDWQPLSPRPCYPMAAINTRHAGKCTAYFIKRLLKYNSASDIHVIGFSLGGQVAASTANYLRPYKLPRITGLDPALPLFITNDKKLKLDSSDAEFVDVIHTNSFVQGKADRCGHIDFYVNGGINQPGCNRNTHNPMSCDHHRSVMYFAESIRSKDGFWGWPCSSMAAYLQFECPPKGEPCLMGAHTQKKSRGYCLVYTAMSSPYALGSWQSINKNNSRWRGRLLPKRWSTKQFETNLLTL